MTRKPRTTMSELQRALSRARLPHLELVKLVGRGYFLKNNKATFALPTVRVHPQDCTGLMPAREMLTYLNGLADGVGAGRLEVLAQMEGYQIALVAALDKLGGA